MALIMSGNFDRLEKNRNSVHQSVDSTYTAFTDYNGNKFIQIDTYGSKDRMFRGKVSQSIQFNDESAQMLLQIIRREFGFDE